MVRESRCVAYRNKYNLLLRMIEHVRGAFNDAAVHVFLVQHGVEDAVRLGHIVIDAAAGAPTMRREEQRGDEVLLAI